MTERSGARFERNCRPYRHAGVISAFAKLSKTMMLEATEFLNPWRDGYCLLLLVSG